MFLLTSAALAARCCSCSRCFCSCTLVDSSRGVNRRGEIPWLPWLLGWCTVFDPLPLKNPEAEDEEPAFPFAS